ncbi:MAG TPA: hypothetical protein VNK44_05795 [Candidatus Nitrosotenuis sp.]|nr:hypothetical protein [Candidatus Nitrosotenuis sp.]
MIEPKMMLTYNIRHSGDFSSELKKAKAVAEFAIRTRSQSSKDVIHNNWNKTEFTIGISSPKLTEDITSAQYVDLVKDAIGIWQNVLSNYAKDYPTSNHLSKIKFHISESCAGNEDIVFQWWFADPYNGLRFCVIGGVCYPCFNGIWFPMFMPRSHIQKNML